MRPHPTRLETHHEPPSPSYAGLPAPLRTSLRTLFAATVTTTLTAGVAVAGVALAAPAQAENRVTPGNFTGYGFDQCLAPTQTTMNTWMEFSPFQRGRHLHLRRLAGLPDPAEPHPDLDQHPAARRMAAAADHPRPAELLRRPVPAVRRLDRPDDPGELDQQLRRRAPTGRQRGQVGSGRPPSARHHGREHALVRPRGLVERRTTSRAASRPCRSCSAWTRELHRLDYVSGVYSSAGSGMVILDNARVNRPQLRAARQDLDRPLGRHGQHVHLLHP